MTSEYFFKWVAITAIVWGIIMMTGCAIGIGPDGKPIVTIDPVAVADLAQETADKINERFVDQESGK